MLLFHHMQTTVLNKIEDIDKLIDPLTVEPKLLPWLASWLNFHLNSSLPLHQQREAEHGLSIGERTVWRLECRLASGAKRVMLEQRLRKLASAGHRGMRAHRHEVQ